MTDSKVLGEGADVPEPTGRRNERDYFRGLVEEANEEHDRLTERIEELENELSQVEGELAKAEAAGLAGLADEVQSVADLTPSHIGLTVRVCVQGRYVVEDQLRGMQVIWDKDHFAWRLYFVYADAQSVRFDAEASVVDAFEDMPF